VNALCGQSSGDGYPRHPQPAVGRRRAASKPGAPSGRASGCGRTGITCARQLRRHISRRALREKEEMRSLTQGCNVILPGQYFDAETGLNYNYNRDYDPATGRYVEADPLGMVEGTNVYLYANDKPTQLTDAFGLMTDEQCCLRSQQLGQNESPYSAGWVICCEGRKVPCAYTPGTARKGWDIIRSCIYKHERTHLPDIQCPNCTKDPTRPSPSSPNYPGSDVAECRAARVELPCLRSSIAACGNDNACRREVQEYISNHERYYRGCNPKP
jgi:RHS repeat-associated protein